MPATRARPALAFPLGGTWSLVSLITPFGDQPEALREPPRMNLADQGSIEAGVEQVLGRFGAVDVLVNNPSPAPCGAAARRAGAIGRMERNGRRSEPPKRPGPLAKAQPLRRPSFG